MKHKVKTYTPKDIDYSMPSKTDQQFRSETNANNIMAKAYRGHVITHLRRNQGSYADVSKMKDLMGTFAAVEKAQKTFQSLPSELRYRMGNDPRNLPQFMQDPKNIPLLTEYGILEAPPEPKTTPVKPTGVTAKADEPKASKTPPTEET